MQMRHLALAATAASFLFSGTAHALNTVEIVWRASGSAVTSTPTVGASSTIVADLVMTADAAGVSGMGVTIVFDPTELQYVSGQEFTSVNAPGMGNVFNPLAIGVSVDNTAGTLSGFDQADLAGAGLISATATLGSFKFHVVGPPFGDASDIDLTMNALGGSDGFVDSAGNGLPTPTFIGASVTPEPTTALLLLAGVLGLGYAGRRSI